MPLTPEQESALKGIMGRIGPGAPPAPEDEAQLKTILGAPDLDAGLRQTIQQGVLARLRGPAPTVAPGVQPPPDPVDVGRAVAGKVAGTAADVTGLTGLAETFPAEVEQRGPALAIGTMAAKTALPLAVGGPGTRAALRALQIPAAATATAGHRLVRYVLAPFAAGLGNVAIEGASRKAAGMSLPTGGEMGQEVLATALAQWPAAFLQARQFRNEEIARLDGLMRRLQRDHLGVLEARYRGESAALGRRNVIAGATDILEQSAYQANAAGGPPPSLDLFGRNVQRELVLREGQIEAQKNRLYGLAGREARRLGLTARGVGPTIAQDARDVLAVLRRAASPQTAIMTGASQNIEATQGLEEAIDRIVREAAGLTDVPYMTLDRWRAQLQSHAPTAWQRSRQTESYKRGTLEHFFGRLRGEIDNLVANTPVADRLREADTFFGSEVVRIRDLKSKAVAQSHPGTFIEAIRNAASRKGNERVAYLLDQVDPSTAAQLRALNLEDVLNRHRTPDGLLDVDRFADFVAGIQRKHSVGNRDMQIIFGAQGGRVRNAVAALQEARSWLRLNDPPPELQAALARQAAELQAAGNARDALVRMNEEGVQRAMQSSAVLGVAYEALDLIRTGNWKPGIGALLGAPMGTAFIARMLSDRYSINVLSRLTQVADTAAGNAMRIRLGSQLVARLLSPDFIRADEMLGTPQPVEGVTAPGSNLPPVGTPQPVAAR